MEIVDKVSFSTQSLGKTSCEQIKVLSSMFAVECGKC